MWKDEARRLVRDLCRLLRAWWRLDGVRVSVREGRLLRLEPSCLLLISGRLVQVRDRSLRADAVGVWVVYRCEGETGSGDLWARPGCSPLRPLLRWHERGCVQELSSEQIEVIGGRTA